MKISIAAIEKFLPGEPIASEVLDRQTGGIHGRIEKNTGVRYRYCAPADMHVADMGAEVLKKALKKADLGVHELDLLLYAGASYDYPVPHTSVLIKSRLADDSMHFTCLDIDSTCLSFLNALDIAHLYLTSGRYKTIALITAEMASRALSPNDEKVYGLFGDAAVAIILQASAERGYQQGFTKFKNFPSGALFARVPVGGAVDRGMNANAEDPGYFFTMNGKGMIRLTTEHLEAFISDIEVQGGWPLSSFDALIIHQTSRYGNEYFEKRYQPGPGQLIETLSDHGNCIAASIPLGLEKWYVQEPQHSGKRILLLGTGAGLTLGSMVLEFT